MEKPTISKGRDPHGMSPRDQEKLARQLYAVHCKIFDGVDYPLFKHYLLAPQANRTRIYTFHNASGRTVGYIAVHDLLVHVENQRLRVLRTEVGLEKVYRGHNAALKVIFREGLRAWFQNGCRKLWFLATPVHPNPYCAAARQMAEMYPRPGKQIPGRIAKLMEKLSAKLALEACAAGSQWQRKVGWRVKNSEQERKELSASKDPHVQFYLRENPDYPNGLGLLMLVPCHLPNAVSSAKALLRKISPFHRNSRSSKTRKASPSTPLSLASTNAMRSSTLP